MNDIIIVWFRNDLRLHDNETLQQAINDAQQIVPIYCFDPRDFETTTSGFPKTGAFRTKFILETVRDLKLNLQDRNADLIIKIGKPEEIIFALAKHYQAKAVYCQQDTTSLPTNLEQQLERNLHAAHIKLQYFWGQTLYHYDDLPFDIDNTPNSFLNFKKTLQHKTSIRPIIDPPNNIPVPNNLLTGNLPTLNDLNLNNPTTDQRTHIHFKGGETQAQLRLKYYLWETNLIEQYNQTKNALLGSDYSTKFSPYLALGSLSPRQIYYQLTQYRTTTPNQQPINSLVNQLIKRDHFKFINLKHSDTQTPTADNNLNLNTNNFQRWIKGTTGIPFIDANMRQLYHSGFMSNKGRQNVSQFLVNHLQLHWTIGAQWFQSQLIDYDHASNNGNWQQLATNNNHNQNHIIKQAHLFDPQGTYVKHWCPELQQLPSTRIHEPYKLDTIEQKYLRLTLGKDYPTPCIDTQQWL